MTCAPDPPATLPNAAPAPSPDADPAARPHAAPALDVVIRVGRHSFTRFAAFGLLGLAVDVLLLWLLLSYLTGDRTVAVTVAFAITYALNFTLNRLFTFTTHGSVGGQLARFVPQVIVDYLLTIGAVETLTRLGLGVVAARVLAGATNAALNYTAYRFWTFRRGTFRRGTFRLGR